MITIQRSWNAKQNLIGLAIRTSGGEWADVAWNDKKEATITYGSSSGRRQRLLRVVDFLMGDTNAFGKRENVVEISAQKLIKHGRDRLFIDGEEMPKSQMKFDLTESQPAEKIYEKEMLNKMAVLAYLQKTEEAQKLQLVRAVLTSQDEAKLSFAAALFGVHKNRLEH